jgi:hypothetical protein
MVACASTPSLLENLISIRICGRDQKQHILTKQRLVGIAGTHSPSEQSTTCLHVFRWRKLVSLVLDLTPNSLESYIPFSSHLLRKQNYSAHPSSLANAKTAWWSAGISWHLSATIATAVLWETFHIWLYTPPSHHLGSGRRPEKMRSMELLPTTYHRKL